MISHNTKVLSLLIAVQNLTHLTVANFRNPS